VAALYAQSLEHAEFDVHLTYMRICWSPRHTVLTETLS